MRLPLVRFGLLSQCFGMQFLGVAVCCNLLRLGSPSAFPCSRHLVRFVHHRPYLIPELAVQV